MELQETKLKLIELEQNPSLTGSNEKLETFVARAKASEAAAMERITELTEALRDSKQLRKENLLMESTSLKRNPDPLTSDPRIIDLQNELVSLQQDLLNARNLKDQELKN